MNEQRYMNGNLAKWYYNLNGDITDGETIFETHTMPKKDVNEVFYDEEHKGSNSLMDLLNELTDENQRIRQTIKEAYETERTTLGRNVLKQLLEAIQ